NGRYRTVTPIKKEGEAIDYSRLCHHFCASLAAIWGCSYGVMDVVIAVGVSSWRIASYYCQILLISRCPLKIIIAQFAKAPIPGQVKTRLVPGIDAQQACQLHEFLVRTVAHNIQTFIAEDTSGLALQHELWCSQHHEFFNEL